MAQLTATRPTAVGVVIAGAAVSASDTIQVSDLGSVGAHLIVFNGGASPDTVAILDANVTPAGNTGASTGGSVTNGTNKAFFIDRQLVGAGSSVTITHSFVTSVTYMLIPIG